jgi:hypothetical protein
MKGAAQRYEELGDAKGAVAINERLVAMQHSDEAPADADEPDEQASELELVGAEPELPTRAG